MAAGLLPSVGRDEAMEAFQSTSGSIFTHLIVEVCLSVMVAENQNIKIIKNGTFLPPNLAAGVSPLVPYSPEILMAEFPP